KDAIPTGDVTSGPSADAENANMANPVFESANSVLDSNPLSESITKDLTSNQTQPAALPNNAAVDDVAPIPIPQSLPAEPIGSTCWPAPNALLVQLDQLSAEPECKNWVENVKALCLEVCRTSPTEPQKAAPSLRQLQSLAEVADTLAGTLKSNQA